MKGKTFGSSLTEKFIIFLNSVATFEGRGYHFITHSDTEVIIHLYDEYGTDCVKYLRGMFAFGIWDTRRQRLFLARDRVGQKPLFYLESGDALVFASEIKAILQDPSYQANMNFRAMSRYLTYQYVPPPDTIFQHIHKLPPAHTLVAEHGKITIECYWNLSYQPKIRMNERELLRAPATGARRRGKNADAQRCSHWRLPERRD